MNTVIATANANGTTYRLIDNGNYTWRIQRRSPVRGWVPVSAFRNVDAANCAWERYYVR